MADSTTDKSNNLTNDLFDAIYTIVTGVVTQQNYDITQECRIIEVYLNDKGERTGIYKVRSQDAVYDAYARQGDIYSIDQNVYVQIPNGDFNNQKFIIGLKINTEDDQAMYNLKLPFDDFVGFYNLTRYTPMQPVQYWANCDYQGVSTNLIAENFPISEDHVWHWENVEGRPIIASKLGIEVDVTTLLHTFRPIAGKYGFRVVIRGQYSENDQTEAREVITKEYYFTNDNMYGNPYAYVLPSTQQIVFDTKGFKSYDAIDVWFWQDHNFLDELGEEIPWYPDKNSQESMDKLISYYETAINNINTHYTAVHTAIQVDDVKTWDFSSLDTFTTALNKTELENAIKATLIDKYIKVAKNINSDVNAEIWIAAIDTLLIQETQEQINILETKKNNKLTQAEEATTFLLNNILFENMHVLLGLSVAELNEETVTIYTYDTTLYGDDPNNAATREETRTLYAAWVHKVDNTIELIDTKNRLKELNAKIYWYNYDPKWTPENKEYNVEELSHRLGGIYWKPYSYIEQDEYPENTPISFEVKPNRNRAKERYKCIIYYDQTYVISNVFIFQNFNGSIESDNANLARNDRIILRCATLQHSRYIIKNDKSEVVGISYEKLTPGKQFKNVEGEFELFTESYTIEIDKTVDDKDYNSLVADDAIGNFFVYDENNAILANDNNVLFSDVRYFIEPWIRVDTHIDSDYIETNGSTYVRLTEYTNEDGIKPNFKITWQFPESFTMIRSWGLLDDTARNIGYWNHRSEELFELDKKATRYFYIDAIHNIRYNDNDIVAVIEIEGMGTFNAKKELLFGRAGAFGCEFNPVITITQPAGNFYINTTSRFAFKCLIYDRTGNLMPEEDRAQCKFKWKYIGIENYKPADNEVHLNDSGFIGNVITGHINSAVPFVIEVTISNAASYDITVRRGIMVCDDPTFMNKYDVVVPSRIEFNSDGQMPIFASNAFEVQKIITEVTINNKTVSAQNELVYPQWNISNEAVLYLIAHDYEYPIFTLPDGSTTADDPNAPKTYTTYSLAFSSAKLNEGVAIKSDIAQQWTEALATDEYFTYLYFDYDGARVAQAIAFAQNLYPSSLVNEWDGQSLTLDEINSAVIAKMIAAGTKDGKNRFTGVMMGDWSAKGDSSLDIPGLYGFAAGKQSFGFKTNGTGFIGPSGEGRIQFDGRNAIISNSTYTSYINLNPRRLSDYLSDDEQGTYIIDNQAWNSIGNQSISQYFLYNKTPRRITTFGVDSIENWETIQSQYWDQDPDLIWPKQFFKDDKHDYFIVDPSYGVVTTGGIFAQYGRIGKNCPWIISDYGLTQKNFFGKIFLGDPEKNLSIGTYIPNPTFTFGDKEVVEYEKTFDDGLTAVISIPDNFFTFSIANVDNIIQTGIRSDGYLYTKYAAIANWYVNDYEIYVTDLSEFNNEPAQGFRKKYQEENGLPIGFHKDYINLNSKEQFLSFNKGHMIINGKYGWMGFYNNDNGDTLDLSEKPNLYNMLIDFKSGKIGFSKLEADADPLSQIDGTNGWAYFANKNIILAGKEASMYIGCPVTGISNSDYIEGSIYLSKVKLYGAASQDSSEEGFMPPNVNISIDNYNFDAQMTIERFEVSTLAVEGENDNVSVEFSEILSQLEPQSYSLISLNDVTPKQIKSPSAFCIGYTKDIPSLEIATPSVSGSGLYIGVGGNDTYIKPIIGTGYLLGDWYITAKALKTDMIQSPYLYVDNSNAYVKGEDGYSVIASQLWVYKKLGLPLWKKTIEVNNLAAKALTVATKGLKRANYVGDQLDKALKALNGTSVIYQIRVDRDTVQYQGGTFVYAKGSLTLSPGNDGQFSLKSITSVDIEGGDGSFTVKLNTAFGDSITSNPFNIAATKYHMDQIAAAYKAGYSAGFAQCERDTQYTKSSYSSESDYYSPSDYTGTDPTGYTASSHSHSSSSYSASVFSPAQEETPSSGWEAYY